jgi:phytol kinase
MHEYGRQVVHLVFGLGIASILLVPVPGLAVLIYASGLLGGLVLIEALLRGWYVPGITEIIGALEREDVFPGKGTVYFVASALFCSVAFTPRVAFVAVLSLTVLDSVATIAGLRFGRHPIVNGRTLEGSGAGFLALFVVLLPMLPLSAALLVAGVAALAELLSPIDDNLVIPAAAGAFLTLLS